MALHTIEFHAGENIGHAAVRLVEAAEKHGEAVGTFNDIELRADATTTAESVSAFYMAESNRRAEAYRKSPEGQRVAKLMADRKAAAQATADRLVAALPTLDMTDDSAVLYWLCDLQDPSDYSGVVVPRQQIVEVFEKAGFVEGANCGVDYRADDRDNAFRYLVGQALSGLKRGPSIHGIIHKFAGEWRERFNVPR